MAPISVVYKFKINGSRASSQNCNVAGIIKNNHASKTSSVVFRTVLRGLRQTYCSDIVIEKLYLSREVSS
jgi:hypothetical protein